MKADTLDLAAIFGPPVRFLVPLFQRPYVWREETEWQPLWDDVAAVLERQLDDTPANDAVPHFLGAVVLGELRAGTGKVQTRTVIDGQQRLTTLQVFIAAAHNVAQGVGLAGPSQMFGKLLFNDDFLMKTADDRFKLTPSVFDRDAFRAAIEGSAKSERWRDHRISMAYRFFDRTIREWVVTDRSDADTARRFEVLSTVLWKLLVVVAIDLGWPSRARVRVPRKARWFSIHHVGGR